MTSDVPAMITKAWFLPIRFSILWGGSLFFAEIALRELPPFTVVLGRAGIAAIAVNLLVIATGKRMPRKLGLWEGAF